LVKSLIDKDAGMRIRVGTLLREFKSVVDEVFEESRNNYVWIYREAAPNHIDVMADLEVFPGILLGNVSEEDQVRILQKDFFHRPVAPGQKLELKRILRPRPERQRR